MVLSPAAIAALLAPVLSAGFAVIGWFARDYFDNRETTNELHTFFFGTDDTEGFVHEIRGNFRTIESKLDDLSARFEAAEAKREEEHRIKAAWMSELTEEVNKLGGDVAKPEEVVSSIDTDFDTEDT